ncbi:MAG TPA: PH domain-containing protein [Solirubrobacteraceae bacterium]|nr:PH domain-containing protein [Solirubrobacteraceae bacterium]
MTELPSRRLARSAQWVWRLQQALAWGIAVIAVLVIAPELDLPASLALIPLAILVVAVTVAPVLRWRAWRWDVRPEAIEIRRGVLVIRHTVVPMVRVQHVDTTSGLLEQAFDLYSVEIHTAADSHKIPLLETRDADELRRRIEELTDES